MATSRICVIPNCGKPVKGRGWCAAHWLRWYKHGSPLAGGTAHGALEKFYREVVLIYEGEECLIWPFGRNKDGRAVRSSNSGSAYVYRRLCEDVNGPPPTPTHEAAHSCGKAHLGCVTRGHLSWKTPKENSADREVHGTHTRGSTNGSSKLTDDEVLEIRSLSARTSQQAIADEYGVSQTTVSKIVRRMRWAWLP